MMDVSKDYEEHKSGMRILANKLHNRFCMCNHIDQCGWEYEGDDLEDNTWKGLAHKRWMNSTEYLVESLRKDGLIFFDIRCGVGSNAKQ